LNLVLNEAVERGDLRTVKAILEKGYDPNIPDPEGRTPLLISVISGDPGMVRLLLSHDADPFFDGFHDIPVCLASAFFGHLGLVRMFLNMGLDMVHYRSSWGDTALSYASKRNFPAIVRFLVASGSDVNVKNRYGVTPLITAASQGNTECCCILLSGGANVNETDNLGRSVLRHAVRARCKPDLMRLLLTGGADPLLKDMKGRTVFWEPYIEECLPVMLEHYSFLWRGKRCSLEDTIMVIRVARTGGNDPSEFLSIKKIPPEATASGGR